MPYQGKFRQGKFFLGENFHHLLFLSDAYVKANQKNVGRFNLHYCQS